MTGRARAESRSAATAARLRRTLVEALQARQVIRTDAVAAAFAQVPREHFIPEVLHDRGLKAVYSDEAFVTTRDARGLPLSSSSQPAMMAEMLELLDLRPGQRVLEIGAGTGYNAALLANIVGPTGRVDSIDIDAETAGRARRALRGAGVKVRVAVGDGRDGFRPRAPYDRIIATACADALPLAWLEQLAESGRLEPVLRLDPDGDALQVIPVFERRGMTLRSYDMTWGGFMPLHGGDGGWRPPQATLSAGRSRSGRHTAFVSLSGQGLARLSDPTARSVLAATLDGESRPRTTGLTPLGQGHTPLLLIYLLTRIPERRRIWIRLAGRHGIGIVDAAGRTVAAVSLRSAWMTNSGPPRRKARWQLHSFGDDGEAGRELRGMMDDWCALATAGRPELEISARPRGAVLRLRLQWRAGMVSPAAATGSTGT